MQQTALDITCILFYGMSLKILMKSQLHEMIRKIILGHETFLLVFTDTLIIVSFQPPEPMKNVNCSLGRIL